MRNLVLNFISVYLVDFDTAVVTFVYDTAISSFAFTACLYITALIHHAGPVIPSSAVFGEGGSTAGYISIPCVATFHLPCHTPSWP
jgi:hypothetical protein